MESSRDIDPEEQGLRQNTAADTTIDEGKELQDADQLADEEEVSHRFSRRKDLDIKYGNLKPLVPVKKNEYKVLIGPDCKKCITKRGVHNHSLLSNQRVVFHLYVLLLRSIKFDGQGDDCRGVAGTADLHYFSLR